MSIYKYQDFEKAARAAGMLDKFSTADLNLAQKNPDAGMSILKYKQDYNAATTDEARALANAGAEKVRSSYGGYTGGGDGGSFKLEQMSPNTFSYDPDTDPKTAVYRKAYAREGARATESALAKTAAMTGGTPGSYAVGAAAQAGNYYAAQLADKEAELYEAAYQRHLDEIESQRAGRAEKLNEAAIGAELGDYSRYGAMGYDTSYAEQSRDLGLESQQASTYATRLSNAFTIFQNTGDPSALKEMGIDTSNQELMNKLAIGEIYASHGDYSYLNALGVDTSYAATLQQRESADWAAQYGDLSGLDKLGVDTSYITEQRQKEQDDHAFQRAITAAEYGDYSGLSALGIDTSQPQFETKLNIALTYHELGDSSKLAELGVDVSKLKSSGGNNGEVSDELWMRALEASNDGTITSPSLYNALVEKYGSDVVASVFTLGVPDETEKDGEYVYEGGVYAGGEVTARDIFIAESLIRLDPTLSAEAQAGAGFSDTSKDKIAVWLDNQSYDEETKQAVYNYIVGNYEGGI